MELICPNCDARYRVSATAVPPGGRNVTCAKCGANWHAMPPELPAAFEGDAGESAPPPSNTPLPADAPAEPITAIPVIAPEIPAFAAGPAAATAESVDARAPSSEIQPTAPPQRLGAVGWLIIVLVVAVAALAAYGVASGRLALGS